MRSRQGKITILKFKLEYETELQSVLKSLGMQKVFNPTQGNCFPLSNTPVAIDTVKHKAVIEVKKTGIEAAAVTPIGIRTTSAISFLCNFPKIK